MPTGMDLRGFRPEVVKGMAEIRQIAVDTTLWYAFEFRANVADRTPIDTGRHSASWNLNRRVPNLNVKPLDYYAPFQAPTAGEINVAGYRLGEELWVSNDGPAILPLNAGHSRQAPAMFVEVELAGVAAGVPRVSLR